VNLPFTGEIGEDLSCAKKIKTLMVDCAMKRNNAHVMRKE
jgi:hypothetical protein